MKKLKRSSSNKVIAGVFGGLGEYMDVDPTILRLIGLLLFLITGLAPFIVVYIIAVLIIPKTEEQIEKDTQTPAWKKWWFWIIILLIVLALIPIFALIAIRGFGPIANVSIHTEEGVSRSSEASEVVIEEKEPEKEEIVDYLKEEIVATNHEGEVFADYYRFGRDADKLYVWAYISEYYLEEGELKVGSAASLPLALEFEDGKVVDYIKPRDGSDYTQDINRIFPSHIANKISNIQEQAVLSSENEYEDLITHLEDSTKEMAEDYFNRQEEEN